MAFVQHLCTFELPGGATDVVAAELRWILPHQELKSQRAEHSGYLGMTIGTSTDDSGRPSFAGESSV